MKHEIRFSRAVLATLIISLFSSLVLSGCREKIVIQNGVVPSEAISLIRPYLGTYEGHMSYEDIDGKITLGLNDEGQLTVDTTIVPYSRCMGQVGLLKSAEYVYSLKKGKLRILKATFELDPNLCHDKVPGREVTFNFGRIVTAGNSQPSFQLSVYNGMTSEFVCYTLNSPEPRPWWRWYQFNEPRSRAEAWDRDPWAPWPPAMPDYRDRMRCENRHQASYILGMFEKIQ